jgi:hypothetical protein
MDPRLGALTRRIGGWLIPLWVWFLWLHQAWPARVFFTRAPAGEDTLEVMWALAWYRRALFELHTSPLFHPLAFAPQGWHVAKLHHGPFLIALMLPAALLGGDAFAVHFFGWLVYSLAFLGAFRLAYLLSRDRGLATAAGIAYALFHGSYAAMRIYGNHLPVATAGLVWMAWALERARAMGWSPRALRRAGILWGLGIAGNLYLMLLGGALALVYIWGAWRRKRLGRFLLYGVGTAVAIGGPWVGLWVHAIRQDQMLGQTLETARGNGYPWADALTWNPYHPGSRHLPRTDRPVLTLGLVPAGSSLIGLGWSRLARRRLRSRRLLRAAALGALLATGIALRADAPLSIPEIPAVRSVYEGIWRIGHVRKPELFREPSLPEEWARQALTPLLLLWAVVPFYEAAGTVWRFIALTALGLFIGGAEAWSRIAPRGFRWGWAALWLGEALMRPIPTLPWPYAVHPAFEWLRRNPEPGAVIDVFADHTPGLHLSRVTVMATEYHRRPTLSGFPPFHPRWIEALQRGRGLLFRHRPDWLGRHGFRFLVVHRPPPDWRKWGWPFSLEGCFEPPSVPSPWDYPICIFRIPDRGEPEITNLLLLGGWSGPEAWGIWAEGTEAEALYLAEAGGGPATLELEAFPLCRAGEPQRLEVLFNGRRLGEESFPDCEERRIRWEIPARAIRQGVNEVRFRFAYAAPPPAGDARWLAVGFRRIWIFEKPAPSRP